MAEAALQNQAALDAIRDDFADDGQINGGGQNDYETVLERSLGAGTYAVSVFNGTGYRATTEGAIYYLTNLDLNITVEKQ